MNGEFKYDKNWAIIIILIFMVKPISICSSNKEKKLYQGYFFHFGILIDGDTIAGKYFLPKNLENDTLYCKIMNSSKLILKNEKMKNLVSNCYALYDTLLFYQLLKNLIPIPEYLDYTINDSAVDVVKFNLRGPLLPLRKVKKKCLLNIKAVFVSCEIDIIGIGSTEWNHYFEYAKVGVVSYINEDDTNYSDLSAAYPPFNKIKAFTPKGNYNYFILPSNIKFGLDATVIKENCSCK